MKHIFITYGDTGYEAAKVKICKEAKATCEFDDIISYVKTDLSDELLHSDIINIKRGGGLWSWKPDILLKTIEKYQEGDIIVYCDAGCTLYPSKEWKRYWDKLEHFDIIAQRIYQRTDHWTRNEILDKFSNNGKDWQLSCQYQATTIIIRISAFTKMLVNKWRNLMINQPILAMDVTEDERPFQHKSFKENRHDQAIYSALIYKYLANTDTQSRIYTQWEHIEDLDIFSKQAIRATRLRHGEKEKIKSKIIGCFKCILKRIIFRALYQTPLNKLYIR